jgi:hypothetical protein
MTDTTSVLSAALLSDKSDKSDRMSAPQTKKKRVLQNIRFCNTPAENGKENYLATSTMILP